MFCSYFIRIGDIFDKDHTKCIRSLIMLRCRQQSVLPIVLFSLIIIIITIITIIIIIIIEF